MVAAWVMCVSGCASAGLGIRKLVTAGRAGGPLRGGAGRILMGAGLAVDGVPVIAGWSPAVGSTVAGAGLLAVLLGAALQLRLPAAP